MCGCSRGWFGKRSVAVLFVLLLALTLAVPAIAEMPEAPRLKGGNVGVEGLNIHYRMGGSGPCLLMLHGFTLTGEEWEPLALEFLPEYTVILADLPGHGGSSALPGDFSLKQTAHLMHGLLDQIGVKNARGIGHSAGAMTLLHMAVERPQRLEAVVLVAGANAMGSQARKLLKEYKFELMDPRMQEFYWKLHPGGRSQVDRIFRQLNALAENREDIPIETLSALKVKTLLVWGDRDEYFPLSVPMEMYRALPDAALWVVPGQGHGPLWESFGGAAEAACMFPAVVKKFWAEK